MGTVDKNAQLRSLCDIARAVSDLNQDGKKIELEVYVPEPYLDMTERKLGKTQHVTVFKAPPNTKAPEILCQADILVIPINFDRKSLRYIKLSLPAKCFCIHDFSNPNLTLWACGCSTYPIRKYRKMGACLLQKEIMMN